MSSHLETNKWTPKLIIVFQLTIWSIVGIILLQKGAISLREKMKPRNDTADVQDKLARWNGKESIREPTNVTESSRHHAMKVYQTGTRRTNVATDNVDDVTSNEWLSRILHPSHRTRNINRETFKKTLTIGERETITTTVRHEYDTRGTRAIQTVAVHVNNKNEVKNIKHEENVIVSLASNERSYDTENTVMINNITPNVLFEFENDSSASLARPDKRKSFEHDDVNDITTYETTGYGKSETKPRRSPVNRIGAAIAIIMLAIGIIMLLLGPFIVILRALSNRRRTRETLHKKRNHDDRPPTYEEATLMDQAPRYSTLQLDTILESSSTF